MSESELKPNIQRFSGFRKPNRTPYQWAQLRAAIEPYAAVLQVIMQEPYFLDDSLKSMSAVDVAMQLLHTGEIYFCFYGDKLAAFFYLSNILPERHATFGAWVQPEFRGNRQATYLIAKELITDYAFAPFGPMGLGLKKLKGEITRANEIAGRAALAIGFQEFGISPCDALHDGIPYDTVLLELLNPDYFAPERVETLSNGPKDAEAADTSDVHSGSELSEPDVHEPEPVPSSAEPSADGPRRVLGTAGDVGRRRIGAPTPSVVAAQPRPNAPRVISPIRR
jgi:RimJ/RimL family protein N-acetyltransferase